MVKPDPGLEFTAPANIGLVAFAVARTGSIALVEFFANSNRIGTGVVMNATTPGIPAGGSSANYSTNANYYQFAWTGVLAGHYVLQAKVTDSQMGTAFSGLIPVVVTTNPPRPAVMVTASDPVASEAGTNPGVFTLRRTGPTNEDLTVYVRFTGTASNGVDYQNLPSSFVIPAGAGAKDVVVHPINDTLREGLESVVLNILPPVCLQIYPLPASCYVVGQPASAVVTIQDDDANLPPMVSLSSPVNGAQFPSGTNILLVANAGDPDDMVVSVEFFANSNSLGIIYASNYPPTVVTNPAGTAVNTYYNPFRFMWNHVADGQYVLNALARDSRGASAMSLPVRIAVKPIIIPPPVTNPPLVTVYATDPYASEGYNNIIILYTNNVAIGGNVPNSTSVYTNYYRITNGINTATFQVRRVSTNNISPLTVGYSVSGTASNGVDYLHLPGSVTIPAGRPYVNIVVTPIDDTIVEPAETVRLTLRPGTGYAVGRPDAAMAVIQDNDSPRSPRILPDGSFNYSVWHTNLTCIRIEASTNLLDWIILGTNSPNTAVHYVDPATTNSVRRFYRYTPVDCAPEN